jgi:hypothetical protein
MHPRVFQINGVDLSSQTVFHQEMLTRGIRLGDIKMGPLDCQLGWEQHFSGHFVA